MLLNCKHLEHDLILSFGDRKINAQLTYSVYLNDKCDELWMGITINLHNDIYWDIHYLKEKYYEYLNKKDGYDFTSFYHSCALLDSKMNKIYDMWKTPQKTKSI